MAWVPEWSNAEDGISGKSVAELIAIGNAVNKRNDYSHNLVNLQSHSRIPLDALNRKVGGQVPSNGMSMARTPEEALYFANAELAEAGSMDASSEGANVHFLDNAEADVADLERAVANGSIGSKYSRDLEQGAGWQFKHALEEIPVKIARAEKAARILHEQGLATRANEQQIKPLSAPGKPAKALVEINGIYQWVDEAPKPQPRLASIKRFAGDRLIEADASQIIYKTMENQGRNLALSYVGALPETDAIHAARLIEAIRATGQYSQGLGGSNAMKGFAAGVLSAAPTRVQEMAQELAGSLISDKAPALWMRHTNGNPNNIHALEDKPVGVEFLAQPNGEYIAAHDSNKRAEYGYLVDGRHRDKIVTLANAKEAANYADWLGDKGWFTNYVDPLGGLSTVRQFSPVGGNFVSWEERARDARRLR